MHSGCVISEVYLCVDQVDFRKSIDGLSALVEQSLGLSPFASALYVFMNRGRTKVKVLYWHRNGFCLWYKRLEAERFAWPKFGVKYTQQFEWLLEGFDVWKIKPHKALEFASVA
jgi:transposase